MPTKSKQFSIVNNSFSTQIDVFETIDVIVGDIITGKHSGLVNQIRNKSGNNANQLKKQLPAFYPCVQLQNSRALQDKQYYQSTGIVQFDIDGLNQQEAENLKQDLITHIPELLYAFISPRYGLKCGVLTDYDQYVDADTLRIEFKAVYALVEQYLIQHISCVFDGAVSSITQACYYSSDPDAYLNPKASVFVVKDNAIKSVVQDKIRQETQNLVNFPVYNTPKKNDVLYALSYIPNTYRFHERLPINFSVIDALGSCAENALLSHWLHKDPKKLRQQIKSQIKSHKEGAITVGTLYKEAQKHGFKFTSHASNKKAVQTNLLPTYNDTIYSISDAQKKLQGHISNFFDNKETTLINVEAGAGKTEKVIAETLKRLRSNRNLKIAFFVPNHALAEEMIERIQNQHQEFISAQTNFSSKMKAASSMGVQHIKGKNFISKKEDISLCDYPSNQLGLSNKTKSTQDKGLVEFFELYPREFCKRCPNLDSCRYIAQFSNPTANIRVYVHNHLLNQPSFFDNTRNLNTERIKIGLEEGQSKGVWKPDYIIIDEDLIATALNDQKLIEQVLYNDCIGSDKASTVMKNLIHESCNFESGAKTFEDIIIAHADEIINASNEQNNLLSQWEKDSGSFSNGSSIEELSFNYTNAKSTKPMHYPMLDKLSKYALHLKTANDVNDFKYHRFFFYENSLCYASKHSIHYKYRDVPMLMLDASANEYIAKAFYGQDLKYETVRIKYQSNVKVHQFENCSFSKKQMAKTAFREKIKKFIQKKTKGKAFGIITYMNLGSIKNFDAYFAQELGADAYSHFGAIRGTDKFKNLDMLFVIGRQYMKPNDLKVKYRQLFGYIEETSENLITERFTQQKVCRCADGQNKAIPSATYVNNRLEECHQFLNNSETYQAGHRLRLIHGDKLKELYILSNEVLDFTVNELLNTRTELGHIKADTDERIKKVVEVINRNGLLYDKNKTIASEIGSSASNIANLKSGGDFVDRVLSECLDAEYIEARGKDKSRRLVKRCFFKLCDASFEEVDLCNHLNLKSIDSFHKVC